MSDTEDQLRLEFRHRLTQIGQTSADDEKQIERAITIANHQTGTRDVITLFIASLFALLVGFVAPVSTQILNRKNSTTHHN